MAHQVAKTTQSLTTGAEMRETTKMLMQPNANWEEYLTPAPLSIAIMGELVFISSCDDFSINKNAPKDGFKYIRYPESFRACLMQICNSGWHAFNEAHMNMDQIRLHTGTVPDYMKAAVNILFNATDEVIENLLPNQLQSIQEIADDCVVLAHSVEKKYSDVINLIQELLEACVNAQHFYGEELENVRRKLEEAKLKEQSAKLLNERSKKAMEAMAKQVEEAQEQYKQSMDSLPSGWEMIGMDFVEGLTASVTGLVNGLTSQMTGPLPGLLTGPLNGPLTGSLTGPLTGSLTGPLTDSLLKAAGSLTEEDNPDANVDGFAQIKALSRSGQILSLVGTLKTFVSGNEIDWKNLYDQKEKGPKSKWAGEQFERISKEMEKMPEDNTRDKVLSLCSNSLSICEELARYKPDQEWDEATTKELIEKLTKLNDEALAFDSMSKGMLGTPALTPKPPMMYKAESDSSESKSAGQRASETARFKIEQSREQLKQTREQYEKCVENMEKNEKELNDVLIEMQNCKVKEIDFDTTVKMLVKGLDAMGRVKEQWEKMVRFFQMVSNIIKTNLSKTLHNFVKTSEDTKKLTYNGKLFAKDLLYNQAFQASNIASLVHMISTTYTEVSNKYLMDRVSSLGRLMAMDKEKPEFEQERLNLQESCRDAQRGILQLVLKNKKEFERKTDGRIAKIEGALKAVLPAAPPEETERIKEIVQASFSEQEQGDYY